MPGKFCTQCGAENEEGKRFCRACGKPLLMPEVPLQAATDSSVTHSTGRFCKACGAPIGAGKAFCTRCGKPVEPNASPAPPAREEPPNPDALIVDPLVSDATVQANESRPMDADALVTGAGEAPQPHNVVAPSPLLNPDHRDAAPLPRQHPVEEPASPDQHSNTTTSPKQLTLRIIAAAAVLIVAASGATAWHFRDHFEFTRNPHPESSATIPAAPSTARAAAVGSPGNIPPPPANASASPTPEPAQSNPSAQPTPPTEMPGNSAPEPKNATSHPEPLPIKASPEEVASTTLTHVKIPPANEIPRGGAATPRSGTLRYTGPPVQYGGIVVFSGLPAGRLRFSFDHQAWQPLISRQPDGSQTLRLRSLQHSQQIECTVQWEIVP